MLAAWRDPDIAGYDLPAKNRGVVNGWCSAGGKGGAFGEDIWAKVKGKGNLTLCRRVNEVWLEDVVSWECVMRAVVFGLMVLVLPSLAQAERRCGWYINPTPANVLLEDADGLWRIGTQGGPSAPGFDDAYAGAFDDRREWVFTNGSYGYGCACVDGEFGAVGSEQVRRVTGFQALTLAQCLADPALPPAP
jgi:hypothetical protein